MSPVLAVQQAILQDMYSKGRRSPCVGTCLKQAEPPRAPSPPPQAAACPSGSAEQGGFIQLRSNADAECQHGPSPAGSPVDRHCRCCTKRWAVREGCKSFPGCVAPGIRGACWRVSPTLKPTTYWTGAPLFFLFSFSVFFSLPPKANHWTHTGRKVFYSIEILFSGNYVKNVFILWAGWEKKGLNPLRWLFL